MTGKRLWQTIRLWSMISSKDRVDYIRKKHIFAELGENVTIMDRKIPLYANLIKIHNNVRIASHVTFATHDVTHYMLNTKNDTDDYNEIIGCIEIMDNVFIGTNATILNNVRIGENSIVAAGAVVAKDVPSNSVVGGVPAKVICSMDDYLKNRTTSYPTELKPAHQVISAPLADFMWDEFAGQRNV